MRVQPIEYEGITVSIARGINRHPDHLEIVFLLRSTGRDLKKVKDFQVPKN